MKSKAIIIFRREKKRRKKGKKWNKLKYFKAKQTKDLNALCLSFVYAEQVPTASQNRANSSLVASIKNYINYIRLMTIHY